MTNLITSQSNELVELQNTKQLCDLLMKTPHYAKMGPEGVFAIVETAKSLNIDPRKALGGGMYYVKGKVEMSARLMNALIRAQKHSITRDKRSDDKICILHGKRADTGDTWTESFSLEEATRAGLTGSPVWKNFTRDMLFARALSRLARQLFPDIIGNCYVEGELSLDPNIGNRVPDEVVSNDTQVQQITSQVSIEEVMVLDDLIGEDQQYRQSVLKFLKKNLNVDSLEGISKEVYDKVYAKAMKNHMERQAKKEEQEEEHLFGEATQMVGGSK